MEAKKWDETFWQSTGLEKRPLLDPWNFSFFTTREIRRIFRTGRLPVQRNDDAFSIQSEFQPARFISTIPYFYPLRFVPASLI